MKKISFLILFCISVSFSLNAQKVVYSEPEKDDYRNMNFNIIGKLNDHFLVHKYYKDNHAITVYDEEMRAINRVKLTFIPNRTANVDILNYKDFFYLFYQYQKKGVVYCMAVKMNGDGKMVSDPVELDTTVLNYSSDSKIYTILNSEDKQKIMIMKINAKNDKQHIVTSILYNNDLEVLHAKNVLPVNMASKNDFLTEFILDNEGDLAFLRAQGNSQNANIAKLDLLIKKRDADSAISTDVDLLGLLMDDIRLKVDNANKHYLLTSFYTKTKRGSIEGIYCSLWDKETHSLLYNNNTLFSDDLRNDAKGENSSKNAFNDNFLQDIVMRKDGGYVIASEGAYTSSRGGYPYSRWDYLSSPYFSPYNYYYMNPYSYGGYYPWYRYGGYYQSTRYNAENVTILSFDSTGKMEWFNVIKKSQYDDNTDNFIGYTTINTGTEVHFLFNNRERQNLLLNDQSIDIDGILHRNPTLKNLNKGYTFMPRFAKQVSSWQIIIPCEYRNYICFAKVEF